MRRSQVILRLPVDNVTATLILHDGERSDVLLFIAAGEDITRLMSPGDPFVPMIKHARFCLVARSAMAAIGVASSPAAGHLEDDGLPVERQRVRVQLRSGTVLEGELRWTAPEGARRTADHVNDSPSYFIVHASDGHTAYYVAKAQVATLEELA